MSTLDLQSLTKQLFDITLKIKPNDAAAIFGTSQAEASLMNLRKKVVQFGDILKTSDNKEQITDGFKEMASEIDSAVIVGVISQNEAPAYYDITDKIWHTIQKQVKN